VATAARRWFFRAAGKKSGELAWKVCRNYYASPLVAGGKLVAPREDGVVFVASIAENSFKLLAENDMGESIIGSPVPFGEGLLLRGERHLFCIGE
jgi:outer membrane protein assembly factor BamB